MRCLSNNYMNELMNGFLSGLVELVKSDDTLDMQIREDSINIYYRGVNALRVSQPKSKTTGYDVFFDPQYQKLPSNFSQQLLGCHLVLFGPSNVHDRAGIEQWIKAIPNIKQVINYWFGSVKNQNERVAQQRIVWENNRSCIANSTDYFICDVEYDNHADARFDLVAYHWPSNAPSRKSPPEGLAVIELKYGDNAMTGKAGICSHIRKTNTYFSDPANRVKFYDEMAIVFEQKKRLGLIQFSGLKNFGKISPPEKVPFILACANHDPASRKLANEINMLANNQAWTSHLDVIVIRSSFLGYGLFSDQQHQLTLEQALKAKWI